MDLLGMIERDGQGDWPAEVVHDEREVRQVEAFDELGDDFGVRLRRVREARGPARQAETRKIQRDAPERWRQRRDEVPEFERPRRRAVDEDDRLTRALVHVVQTDRTDD